ncbi:MAG: DUF1501 domain-containing protein [Verrucomicrobiota bacterium]|jgi:hypothetical protein|nr:DUF1501 domain-containing protein [Verrucomicrobiota bacterium]|tara:strand:- start:1259 stop:2530 length:1272 start_codon:yes stop_codon:yes gene_type:complete
MNPLCTPQEHFSRRAFLKGSLLTGAGVSVANFGSLFQAQAAVNEAQKKGKRCILLWMNGGASQLDTFDMKPGRPTAGPFRPIGTNVDGLQICEYLPKMAKMADKLAVIRSMRTGSPDHPGGIYHMHTGFKQSERTPHAEIGAVIAKYCGNLDADLPSFVRMGPTGNAGPGYLGPNYAPFSLQHDGRMPTFSTSSLKPEVRARRAELFRFLEKEFAKQHTAEPFESHRLAKERAWRLLRAREAFDVSKEWTKQKDRYGDSNFGRGCFMALKLIERGVPFVEIGHDNYDSHANNFVCHKANLQQLDPAWSTLLLALEERGLFEDTLVVWMGEVGRTPNINNRAGRDHYVRAWSIVLAGGGIRGGQVYGASDKDGRDVAENPVSEGDLFATIYTALGINPRKKHFWGKRPVWLTPEDAAPIKPLLG